MAMEGKLGTRVVCWFGLRMAATGDARLTHRRTDAKAR